MGVCSRRLRRMKTVAVVKKKLEIITEFLSLESPNNRENQRGIWYLEQMG